MKRWKWKHWIESITRHKRAHKNDFFKMWITKQKMYYALSLKKKAHYLLLLYGIVKNTSWFFSDSSQTQNVWIITVSVWTTYVKLLRKFLKDIFEILIHSKFKKKTLFQKSLCDFIIFLQIAFLLTKAQVIGGFFSLNRQLLYFRVNKYCIFLKKKEKQQKIVVNIAKNSCEYSKNILPTTSAFQNKY